MTAADLYNGNHIRYTKGTDETHNFIRIDNVDGESCEPKPEKCHCKTMLEKLLKENPQVNRLDGHFASEPFMAGCKCYLGTAADAGFKVVAHRKIKGKFTFDKKNYDRVCQYFEHKKLFGNAKILKE